jgi:predicted HNH restriction endonuclease
MSRRVADCLEALDLVRSFARLAPDRPSREWRLKAVAHVASRGVTTDTVRAHLVGKDTGFTLSIEEIDRLISAWVNHSSPELHHWIVQSSSGAESQRISQFFSSTHATPLASDINEPEPTERRLVTIYRILRDTALARRIKADMNFTCQVCQTRIVLSDGTPYAEAHHVKPLGAPHNGPDHPDNIICVCPNCHVKFDYGSIAANNASLSNVHPEYIRYHNEVILKA